MLVDVVGGLLEVEVTPGVDDRPTLVFLHEGLGSIDLWRGFPADVRAATDGPTTVVYSRHGHGRSGPAVMPRPVDYMHHEADVVLPALLDELEIERPILIGHSDGASISLLYAGSGHAVAGLACIAPHVFVEPESIAGVEAARHQFDTTDMAARMERYHDDPTTTFLGWNDVWRSDEFRTWNIEECLGAVDAPILVVQGVGDQYGTVRQVDAIEAGVAGSCDRLAVDGAGHSPHLDERDTVVTAVAGFVDRIVSGARRGT